MESLLWTILGLGLLAVQFFSGFFDFLPPALAAFALALIALIPGLNQMIWLQVLLWGVLSASMVIWLRVKYPKLFNGSILKQDKLLNSGREAVALEDIRPGQPGRITFEGTSWKAVSIDETILAGTPVVILEQDNMTFTVSAKPLIDDDTIGRGSLPDA